MNARSILGRHRRRQLDPPLRIAVAEVADSDALAVHQRLDPERCVGLDADAAEREREDVVALADPVERERELGTRTFGPDTRFLWIDHPPVSEPAVVAQVVQLDSLTGANVKAPLPRLAPSGPASEPAFARKPRLRRVIVGRKQRHRAEEDAESPLVGRPAELERRAGLFDLEGEVDLAVGRRSAQATRCATPDRRS